MLTSAKERTSVDHVRGLGHQIWEFAEAYQRWQMIAELRESHEKPEPVHHMSWAPNVGR